MSPAARASHGNVDLDRQAMGKNRKRIRFSPRQRPPKQTLGGPQLPNGSRLVARRVLRLLRGEISSCGSATPRGGVRVLRAPSLCCRACCGRILLGHNRLLPSRRIPFRSEVKSRGVMREGRACRGRTTPSPFGRPATSPLLPSA